MTRLLCTLIVLAVSSAIAPALAGADPPANDSFANPRSVPPGLGSNNSSYTAEPGEPAHAGVAANHSIWFRFTNGTAKDRILRVDSCGSNTDTVLSAYESAPDLASLVSIDEDDDGAVGDPNCDAGDSKIVLTAEAGKSYLFALDSKVAASPGGFQFIVRAQPPNANFANAISIPGSGGFVGDVNFFAGAEAGEPAHAGQPATNSAWYSLTSAGNGTIVVDGCESSFDTVIAVYTGTAVNALTPVASNDDTAGCGFGDTGSRVEFAAAAGQTYMIAVDGRTASDQGTFRITVDAPPSNDLFANAENLFSEASASTSANNLHAGDEPAEPAILGDPAEHSVWFRWTAPQAGPVRIDTCGSDFDTTLAVYTGGSLATLTEVASNDDSTAAATCEGGDSLVSFTASSGQQYRIAIDGKAGATGFVHLALVAKPLNDDFAAATPLVGTETGASAFSTMAGSEPGEPQHAGVGSGHSVWYSWTAPVGGIVELSTCSADMDTALAVYTGGAVDALTPVASNDDGETDCSDGDGALSLEASVGTTYRIAVDSVAGEGRVDLFLVRPADVTPPDTSITSGPEGNIESSSASFTYSGTPAFDVASFECSVDGGAFESCPASGTTVSGLSVGGHSLSVRAVDFDGNADPTAAARLFTVTAPADCGAQEAKLAAARAKLKKAKAKLEKAQGRRAVARAKAKVRKAKAKLRAAGAALAECEDRSRG